MLISDRPYIVMGLLDRNSLAWSIGESIQRHGGRVIYTIQNRVVKKRYLDRDLPSDESAGLDFRFCDVSKPDEITAVFSEPGGVAGVVHSLAYADPKSCLGEDFRSDAAEAILRSYDVSCASLARVAEQAVPAMAGGGSIVAMTFESRRAFPYYNWMGVHKAGLEALVRALARRHGRDDVRVNAVSAGPVSTTGAGHIPGFDALKEQWRHEAPLAWDPDRDREAVADTVVFLLSGMARRITGQTVYVDGGASAMGGALQNFEREPASEE